MPLENILCFELPVAPTMAPLQPKAVSAKPPQIQCGSCDQQLPIRLTIGDEEATVWVCAKCNVPFVACCVKEALLRAPFLVRYSEKVFDITGQEPICLSERMRVTKLASRLIYSSLEERRRADRIDKSLVVPATKLGPDFIPVGNPFQIMVANLSSEGVGLVHDEPIDTQYLAVEFSPASYSPVQVIIEIVRQRELIPPYYELGGKLSIRLGSLAQM